MTPTPDQQAESNVPAKQPAEAPPDALGRILFLAAGGLLLATMVSCACNPVR